MRSDFDPACRDAVVYLDARLANAGKTASAAALEAVLLIPPAPLPVSRIESAASPRGRRSPSPERKVPGARLDRRDASLHALLTLLDDKGASGAIYRPWAYARVEIRGHVFLVNGGRSRSGRQPA